MIQSYILNVLKNKTYVIVTVLILIAAYGFTLTHHALSIDDFGFTYYITADPTRYANMIQQGRLTHMLFHYGLRIIDIMPFFNGFLAVILMFFAGVTLLALVQKVTQGNLSNLQSIMFSAIYMTFSIIAFKYVYELDVIVTILSYVLLPIVIMFVLSFIETRKSRQLIYAVILLSIAIGSYESFNAVYICLVLLVLMLVRIFHHIKTKDIFFYGLIFAGIQLVSIISYYATVKVVQIMTKNPQYYRGSILTTDNPLEMIFMSLESIVTNTNFLFNQEIVIGVILFIVIGLYFLIRKKDIILFLLSMAFIFSTFAMIYIQGRYFLRSAQAFNVFFATVILFLLIYLKKFKKIYKIFLILCSMVLVYQVKDLNYWFYKDYVTYQKNVHAIHHIATELVRTTNFQSKAIVFTNRNYESVLLMNWDDKQKEIGESSLVSSVKFLGDIQSRATIELFKYEGYHFILEPTVEQAERGIEYAKEMTHYPYDGYIKEYDDIIVVNIGKP